MKEGDEVKVLALDRDKYEAINAWADDLQWLTGKTGVIQSCYEHQGHPGYHVLSEDAAWWFLAEDLTLLKGNITLDKIFEL